METEGRFSLDHWQFARTREREGKAIVISRALFISHDLSYLSDQRDIKWNGLIITYRDGFNQKRQGEKGLATN